MLLGVNTIDNRWSSITENSKIEGIGFSAGLFNIVFFYLCCFVYYSSINDNWARPLEFSQECKDKELASLI